MQIQAAPDPHSIASAMLEGTRSVGIPMAKAEMSDCLADEDNHSVTIN
jgi:hypothetical protein